jgi:hypothetical protein
MTMVICSSVSELKLKASLITFAKPNYISTENILFPDIVREVYVYNFKILSSSEIRK